MTTARTLKALERVQPTAALCVVSTKREKVCATVVNKTVDGMESSDIAEVAYRYLQCKAGATNSLGEGGVELGVLVLSIALAYYHNPGWLLTTVADILNISPTLENHFRYSDTLESCEDWLKERMSPAQFARLQVMTFDQAGLDCLAELMKEMDCDTTFIEQQANTHTGAIDKVKDLWMLREESVPTPIRLGR